MRREISCYGRNVMGGELLWGVFFVQFFSAGEKGEEQKGEESEE